MKRQLNRITPDMQGIYYELTVKSSGYQESFESFICDLWDGAIEETDDSLIIRDEQSLAWLQKELELFCDILSERVGEKVSIACTLTTADNQDWVQSYKDAVTPVAVGPFYVRPSWYEPCDTKIDLLVDPALAFGTGHHPTTKNALELIAIHAVNGGSMLDVGTGSGILAIGAAKLGMKTYICDTDDIAVQQALSNFELNGVACEKSWTGSIGECDKYDLVVANITADILCAISKELVGALKQGGILVLSGIVEKYMQDVKKAFDGLSLLEQRVEAEWVTLSYQSTGK